MHVAHHHMQVLKYSEADVARILEAALAKEREKVQTFVVSATKKGFQHALLVKLYVSLVRITGCSIRVCIYCIHRNCARR